MNREQLERAVLLARALARRNVWRPLPGPQTLAYESAADVVGYGGAAGGGKTDLVVGKALTRHQRVGVFRRNGTELTAILDRFTEIIGGRDGYNGQSHIWRLDGRQVEFCSVPNVGDAAKYRGRPHDLLAFDEASEFLEADVRFLMGWVRSVDPSQHCQVLMTFNPPTTSEGRWIIKFFAPWLDDKHPVPALPGELRWFATLHGEEVEVAGPEPFEFEGELIKPLSRTFIPAKLKDNPYLSGTNYMAQLQSLPEPLRSQLLNGDFKAGIEDSPWQVIPTAWVEAAMARWTDKGREARMDSLGVDVARGGRDKTVIARRHKQWFDKPITYPGKQSPDGPTTAGQVIAASRHNAPIHIDIGGVGASPYDFLKFNGQQVIGVNFGEKAVGSDRSGRLRFQNLRSELWWRMREALDPAAQFPLALPDDPALRDELTAPNWELRGPIICVESREDIIKRIGHSPDAATAYILALIDTPRMADIRDNQGSTRDYSPLERMEDEFFNRQPTDYNPLEVATR